MSNTLTLRFDVTPATPTDLPFAQGEIAYQDGMVLVHPILTNTSDAVIIWYMLNFALPNGVYWGPLGDAKNWRIATRPDTTLYTFMSNGCVAAFPDYGLALITIVCDGGFAWDIPYTIASDTGRPIVGTIHLDHTA